MRQRFTLFAVVLLSAAVTLQAQSDKDAKEKESKYGEKTLMRYMSGLDGVQRRQWSCRQRLSCPLSFQGWVTAGTTAPQARSFNPTDG